MNKNRIDELIKRQKQKIKLLINHPNFQKTILLLREKWDIPKNGFNNQEDIDKWNEKLNFDSDKYIKEIIPAKRKEIDKAANEGNIKLYRQLRKDLNDNLPRNSFLSDAKKIVHDQRISPRWVNGIKRYLLSNDPDGMALFLGPVIATKVDMDSDLETISIEINEDTTIEDIKAVWPEVKKSQDRLLYKKQKKFQPIKNFERNKKTYELKLEGKSVDEIIKFFRTEHDIDYDYPQIFDFIKKYKKSIGIN